MSAKQSHKTLAFYLFIYLRVSQGVPGESYSHHCFLFGNIFSHSTDEQGHIPIGTEGSSLLSYFFLPDPFPAQVPATNK